jgi:hypothetical protein
VVKAKQWLEQCRLLYVLYSILIQLDFRLFLSRGDAAQFKATPFGI